MTNLDALLDRIEERQKVEGQIQLSTNATSLDFLQAIYRDPTQPIQRRMRAAQAAIPFEHPRLAVVATTSSDDLADRLQKAIEGTAKIINTRPTQVLPPPKVIEAEPEPVPDHSGPFAQNTKSRYRRF